MSSILYFEANHEKILDFSRNIFFSRIHDQWKKPTADIRIDRYIISNYAYLVHHENILDFSRNLSYLRIHDQWKNTTHYHEDR